MGFNCLIDQVRGWNTRNSRWVHDLTSRRVSQTESWPIISLTISVDLVLTLQQMPKPVSFTPGSSPSQVRKAFVEVWTQATRGHRYPDYPHKPVTSLNLASSLLPPSVNPTLLEKSELSAHSGSSPVRWGNSKMGKDSGFSVTLREAHGYDPTHSPQNPTPTQLLKLTSVPIININPHHSPVCVSTPPQSKTSVVAPSPAPTQHTVHLCL